MTSYQLLHIKDLNSNGIHTLLEQLRNTWRPSLEQKRARHYGLFMGLFGLATNEVYWMNYLDGQGPAEQIRSAGFRIESEYDLVPTVRPTEFSPPYRDGIYVFRWFNVLNRHADEIAEISARAWAYFEAGFETEIQGLFALKDRSPDRGRMVLLTWYKNLSVWETSRVPALEATKLFVKRHALTLEALPIATRLLK